MGNIDFVPTLLPISRVPNNDLSEKQQFVEIEVVATAESYNNYNPSYVSLSIQTINPSSQTK